MADVAKYSTQQVLELACAAQRVNGSYVKTDSVVYSEGEDGKFVAMYTKHPNKTLMLVTLDPKFWTGNPVDQPYPLKITAEDTVQANLVSNHYKKLMFAAIDGTNEFLTSVNTILNSPDIGTNQFGYVACLPSLYFRDAMHTNVKRAAKVVDEGWLGEVGQSLLDLDAEILSVIRSKNYEGWNIDAKINNKLASWMAKTELKVGPAVIIKAKIKDCSKHWKHDQPVTRLNYVKAAQ